VFTPDVDPYKKRKVRMLNGAHTAIVPAAYLCGLDTVGEYMADTLIRQFMNAGIEREIMPYMPLDPEDVRSFAASVVERFENPFNRHMLLSIALNSISKFRARVLPSIEAYIAANGGPPPVLTFSMAAMLTFYLTGKREKDGAYPIQDDAAVMECFSKVRDVPAEQAAAALLTNSPMCDVLWGKSLTGLTGFVEAVSRDIALITRVGMREAMERVLVCQE